MAFVSASEGNAVVEAATDVIKVELLLRLNEVLVVVPFTWSGLTGAFVPIPTYPLFDVTVTMVTFDV
jgi:hypothetical protein